jgi:hypothetical protein
MTQDGKAQWHSFWGIINPYGDPWSPTVFQTKEQAFSYLRAFWPSKTDSELSAFKIEQVKVTIERLPTPTGGDDA